MKALPSIAGAVRGYYLRSIPRSFNGRTKVFGAFYVGSIPALGAKTVLACTVHRRTYKPLRSRSEHGLGSTPMRSKLLRMSRRFLIVRQLELERIELSPSRLKVERLTIRPTFQNLVRPVGIEPTMDQDRTQGTFRFGFESRAGYQSLRSGGRAAMAPHCL